MRRLYAQNLILSGPAIEVFTAERKISSIWSLFLNGLPLVTMELKNSLTGQDGNRCGETVPDGSGSERAVVPIQAVPGSLCGG